MSIPSRVAGGRWAALVGLVAAFACDSTGPDSGPGTLEAVIESPAGEEGAAMVEFTGGGITGIRASGGEIFETANGDTTRVLVILETPGRLALTLAVEDLQRLPRWKILQVADGENRLRADPGRYRIRFVR